MLRGIRGKSCKIYAKNHIKYPQNCVEFFPKHESEVHLMDCTGRVMSICQEVPLKGRGGCWGKVEEGGGEKGGREAGSGKEETGLELKSCLHLLTWLILLQVNKCLMQCWRVFVFFLIFNHKDTFKKIYVYSLFFTGLCTQLILLMYVWLSA